MTIFFRADKRNGNLEQKRLVFKLIHLSEKKICGDKIIKKGETDITVNCAYPITKIFLSSCCLSSRKGEKSFGREFSACSGELSRKFYQGEAKKNNEKLSYYFSFRQYKRIYFLPFYYTLIESLIPLT